MSNMFSEESMKIQYNNINSVIYEQNVDFNTSSDQGLCNIKCEFDEEESKIQFGVLENQLLEGKVNNTFSLSLSKLHDNEDGEIPGSFLKNQPTSDKFSHEDVKSVPDECKSEINEKSNTPWDYELSNIKCEFEEEETIIQYGILDEQLREENITASSQKNEPTIFELGLNKHREIQTEERRSTQNDHMKRHAGGYPFKCETCGQCFRQEATLISHRTIHTHNHHLNRHMMIHTGGKPRKCEVCGRCFNAKKILVNHMMIHTGEKPRKCQICGKRFRAKYTLDTHMRIHTGVKPHKCKICGKFVRARHTLNIHMRIHTGEKPYKCEICAKCFSAKANLTTHMRIHTGEKPYKCQTCNKCFSQQGNMRVHTKRQHGKSPINEIDRGHSP